MHGRKVRRAEPPPNPSRAPSGSGRAPTRRHRAPPRAAQGPNPGHFSRVFQPFPALFSGPFPRLRVSLTPRAAPPSAGHDPKGLHRTQTGGRVGVALRALSRQSRAPRCPAVRRATRPFCFRAGGPSAGPSLAPARTPARRVPARLEEEETLSTGPALAALRGRAAPIDKGRRITFCARTPARRIMRGCHAAARP